LPETPTLTTLKNILENNLAKVVIVRSKSVQSNVHNLTANNTIRNTIKETWSRPQR
jgi:hypothetical protein